MDLGALSLWDAYAQFAFACWAILAIYWAAASFSVKRSANGKSWGWLISRVLLVAAVVAMAALTREADFSPVAGAQLWQYQPLMEIAGDAMVLSGVAFAIWARVTLGGNWSGMVELRENHELIESGPYKFVRHPIYSGVLLMVLGSAVIYGRDIGFFAFALGAVSFGIKAFFEERLLTKHFPEAYPKYRARTKALIPFVF